MAPVFPVNAIFPVVGSSALGRDQILAGFYIIFQAALDPALLRAEIDRPIEDMDLLPLQVRIGRIDDRRA